MSKDLLTQAAKVLGENSPRILTAMAAAGVVTTAVLAVQATPEAIRIIERERHQRWLENAKTEHEDDIVIDKIDLVRRGVVRRARLFYLRGLSGKQARIKERKA